MTKSLNGHKPVRLIVFALDGAKFKTNFKVFTNNMKTIVDS
jgi:hypothetical protein